MGKLCSVKVAKGPLRRFGGFFLHVAVLSLAQFVLL